MSTAVFELVHWLDMDIMYHCTEASTYEVSMLRPSAAPAQPPPLVDPTAVVSVNTKVGARDSPYLNSPRFSDSTCASLTAS